MKKNTQIYDGAANLWRKVIVDSVAVRWVDLGTRLKLRHVVKIIGAEGRGQSSNNNNNNEDEQRDEEEGGRGEADDNGERAATVEVDLREIRWAECSGGGQEPSQDESNAKKFAGNEKILNRVISCTPSPPPPIANESPLFRMFPAYYAVTWTLEARQATVVGGNYCRPNNSLLLIPTPPQRLNAGGVT